MQRARIAGWRNKLWSGGVLLALIEVILVASVLLPAFHQLSNIFNILRQVAALGDAENVTTAVIPIERMENWRQIATFLPNRSVELCHRLLCYT